MTSSGGKSVPNKNLNLNVYETNNSLFLRFSFGYVRFCQQGEGNSAVAAESPAPVAETQDSRTIEISGKVIDTNGQPIIGATVFETGTANGITTDLNGGFTPDRHRKGHARILVCRL